METLDSFLPNVTTQDTRKRIQAHQDLVPYLSDPHSSLTCPEMDEFIGGLVGWVNCSNYKVRDILILVCFDFKTELNKSKRVYISFFSEWNLLYSIYGITKTMYCLFCPEKCLFLDMFFHVVHE